MGEVLPFRPKRLSGFIPEEDQVPAPEQFPRWEDNGADPTPHQHTEPK